MLSGSTILRIGLLLVVAVVLAGVVQLLRPRDEGSAEAPVARPVPGIGKAGTQMALPPTVTRPTVPAVQAPPPQAPSVQAVPARSPPAAVPPPEPPAAQPPAPAAPMTAEEAIDSAAETAGPRGVALVDLNTGSVAELNGLKGGGMIGRAIVQRRPYASVGELLSKRVLSRSVYGRIKDQVTVR